MEGLNVLSLFDGMSCGQLALQKAGIKVKQYYAAEIDKYAIAVTMHNYPYTKQLGSVVDVDVKLLCLSEVYSYLCTYDTNLQSKFSEQEVLYWINEEYTISTDFGTQKQNEGQAVQQHSILQCFEEIRITKCGMGGFIKARNIKGCGIDGDKENIGNPFKLQCGEWRYGNDIQSRDTQTNIRGDEGEAKDGNLQTENIGNPQGKISRRERTHTHFRENKKCNVDKASKRELFAGPEENKLNGKVREEESNGGVETDGFIENIIRKLHEWDETNGTSETYRDFLRLHSQEQVTVVKYAGGLKIFKGKFDLICGGSPCQGFSFAGKMLNFKDPRSKLFFEFVRLKNECKPKWFFLENVQMPYEHELVISKYMGIEPIVINSRLLTAQNRVRNYWTNINEQPYGLFGDLKPNIPMPKDKKVFLHDITEPFASDKYLLSEKAIAKILRRNWSIPKIEPDKTGAILPKNNSGQLSVDSGTTLIRCVAMRGREACLSPKRTEYGKQIRKDYEAGKIKEQRKNIQQLEPRNDGKTNTLTSVQKDNLLQIGDKVRRLTELECERLQTVPDGFTNHVSSTQRYKMLGNGWTVDVIAYIFGFMKSELAKSAEW